MLIHNCGRYLYQQVVQNATMASDNCYSSNNALLIHTKHALLILSRYIQLLSFMSALVQCTQ
jgi:hypothetical protein